MDAFRTLLVSLGLAYASGISAYATVAAVGLAARFGLIPDLPAGLEPLTHPAILGVAVALAVVEFLATLIPGVASVWETVHSVIRPPAAAALAVLTTWQADPVLVTLAGVLGGGLGLATHLTKLKVRYAIDTSPEPVTNGAANLFEWSVVGALTYFVWQHPYLSLAVALLLLLLMVLLARALWRWLKRVLRGSPTAGTAA